jgi:hypothetical protein
MKPPTHCYCGYAIRHDGTRWVHGITGMIACYLGNTRSINLDVATPVLPVGVTP